MDIKYRTTKTVNLKYQMYWATGDHVRLSAMLMKVSREAVTAVTPYKEIPAAWP